MLRGSVPFWPEFALGGGEGERGGVFCQSGLSATLQPLEAWVDFALVCLVSQPMWSFSRSISAYREVSSVAYSLGTSVNKPSSSRLGIRC